MGMQDPKRQERIAQSQTKPSRATITEIDQFLAEHGEIKVPEAPSTIPLLNVFYLQDNLKPLEAAYRLKKLAGEIEGAFSFDTDTFTATVAITVATEEADSRRVIPSRCGNWL